MKQIFIALAFALLILTACGESKTSSTEKSIDLPDWNTSLSQKAQLIDRIPADAAFYLRIPSVWGLLFSPKGNGLNNALASEANQNQMALFQQQVKVQIEALDDEITGPLKALLYNLRSPLELVMLLPEGASVTSSNLVISAQFSFENLQQLNQLITDQSVNNPMINFSRPATEAEPGLINIGQAKLYYSYDSKTQIFSAITGLAVFDDDLKKVLAWPETVNSPIKSLEQQIDASGQGFFEWLNFQRFKSQIESTIPASELAALTESGVLQTEYLAFGEGVSAGKGNFSFIATGNNGLLWESTFDSKPLPAIVTAGIPDSVIGLQMVDKNWLNTFIRELSELNTNSEKKESMITEWINTNTEFKQKYGITIEDIIHAFSGQWLALSDDAGRYSIFVPTDISAFDTFINTLEAQSLLKKRSFKMGSSTTIEIIFDGFGSESLPAILSRLKSHVYLQKKQDYYLIADVPQVFVALEQLSPEHSLNSWLAENNISPEKHLFWGASEVKNIPRDNYYAYLAYFQLVLGDLLQSPVAIEDFPTANSLQLAESGTQGMTITYGQGQLGFSLIYDSHPGEYLMGGSPMTTVAIVGVLAAIAIPAYQDYIARVQHASPFRGQ